MSWQRTLLAGILVIVMNVEQSEVTVEAVDFDICFADQNMGLA